MSIHALQMPMTLDYYDKRVVADAIYPDLMSEKLKLGKIPQAGDSPRG
jgi:hypothetical protein